MRLDEIEMIVSDVSSGRWSRRVYVTKDTRGTYLQVWGFVPDLTDPLNPGEASWQKGRKAYISEHAVENEIVQCCLELLIAFETHEIREAFTYKGARIFGPHIDTNALIEIAERTVVREKE